MQAKNNSTQPKRLSDAIAGPPLLRFTTSIRNFHAFLSSLGRCFDGTTDLSGTSEVGLALLFILVEDGEVIWLNDPPTYYC